MTEPSTKSSMLDDASLLRFGMGALGGACITAFVGFTSLGWTTDTKAKDVAKSTASAAVTEALAPICVDRFRRSTEASKNTGDLTKVSLADQGSFIEKGGWAKFGNNTSSDKAIAEACAKIIGAPK
jgi:hypothetical protein